MHVCNAWNAYYTGCGGEYRRGKRGPGLGPVNAFTTENVKRHLLSTELNTRRTDKGFGVSSKEGLTL